MDGFNFSRLDEGMKGIAGGSPSRGKGLEVGENGESSVNRFEKARHQS